MRPNVEIRPLREEEYPLVAMFLYDAIFIPPGSSTPPISVVNEPVLRPYWEHFGTCGDLCLVAESGGQLVGAVWTRQIHGCGFVDEKTPELSISVKQPWRGKGLGTALLVAMLELLKKNGYEQLSLSVQKTNPAVRLYERLGFQKYSKQAEDFILLKRLGKPMEVTILAGRSGNVLRITSDTVLISDVESALDLFASLQYELRSRTFILDSCAFDPAFFDLRTGLAGSILQKVVTYSMRLAIVGDFSVFHSRALADFIRESNRGSDIFFVPDDETALSLLP